tara:strand:- start:123 stop:530 length:408 start_codon:yes stop_codon:yes gene_type:complete
MRICVVTSNFYPEISKNLISGALLKLKKNKISNIKMIKVPGTFEIPVVISNLISKYDGFIALGCVIKGETPHFDYISSSVINALGNLSVQSKKPIGNGILTCNNKKQAAKRADPYTKDKGGEAAYAVISVLKIIK